MVSMTLLMAMKEDAPGWLGKAPRELYRRARSGMVADVRCSALRLAAHAALLAPPLRDALVMPGQQNLGDVPAAVVGRAGVVRVLGTSLQGSAEGLLDRRVLVSERAGELAQNDVAQDHRRELPTAQHVASDRDDVASEVLDDALVEPLVP